MNSKECLDLAILEYEKETVYDKNNQWVKNVLKGLKEVKQYLEQLEKENKLLKDINKINKNIEVKSFKLINENIKLEKALEKCCEMLEYTCPVEEELIDDLDCQNCKDNYKECWKKFFLKEVLE